jgi:hypothetical protein
VLRLQSWQSVPQWCDAIASMDLPKLIPPGA